MGAGFLGVFMLKNKIIYLITGCFVLGCALTIQSKNSDFKASLLSSAQVSQQSAEIKAFYQNNGRIGDFPLKKTDVGDELLTCVCRLKTSDKICGIIYFSPNIKARESRSNDLVILTPNLTDLFIDKKYTSWPSQIEMQSKILSAMLQVIEPVCKQKLIKKLFVIVGHNDFVSQKAWSACGFYNAWGDKRIPFMSSSPVIWLQKTI